MMSDMEMAGERDNHEELGRKPILEHDPGHDENGGLHTMVEGAVRLVTMLNFMKVELGEYKSLKSKEQWRSIGVEFLATLLFVYLGCGSVVASGVLETELTPARLTVIALGHGLAITFLVASTGAISGGHINPVVTLAFVVAGKENIIRGSLYIVAQLVGGICGAALLGASIPAADLGHLGTHSLGHGTSVGNAFLMELMLTFTLVYVIFGVAVDRRGPGNYRILILVSHAVPFATSHLMSACLSNRCYCTYTDRSCGGSRSLGGSTIYRCIHESCQKLWASCCIRNLATRTLGVLGCTQPGVSTSSCHLQ
ncbi:unnamed protein product, partial [Closterium sp. Naga37s-1]